MLENFGNILEGCKCKRRQAQMAFFGMFCKEVYNSSFRILRDQCQAEEVTQDAFLKFFDKIDKVDGTVGSVRSFLKRIAINQSIDIYRRRGAISFISIDDDSQQQIDNDDFDNESSNFSISKIKEELNNMPEGYRLVLTLRLIEEMSFDDIAAQLSITASTVRSQYTRGRKRLQYNLKK